MGARQRTASRGQQAKVPERSHCAGGMPRRGVTLVELLITAAIMAILAAAILGTASAAIEAGKRSRTQSTIQKINRLVMEKWASYETRRVDLRPEVRSALGSWRAQQLQIAANPQQRVAYNKQYGEMLADARLLARRELMKYELPSTFNDLTVAPIMLQDWPALAKSYLRKMRGTGKSDQDLANSNQSAECLYMVVMLATGDGESRSQFNEQDIGDTDDDGLPEFLDGWGEPISWIRWPAGYVSDMQPAKIVANNIVRPGDQDHDPFDPFRRDLAGIERDVSASPFASISRYPQIQQEYVVLARRNSLTSDLYGVASAYRLVPLIYSDGPDKEGGIVTAQGINAQNKSGWLDPYAVREDADGRPFQPGMIADDTKADKTIPVPTSNQQGAKDNITNQVTQF